MQIKLVKWLLASCMFIVLQTKGQNKVVLEQIQSYSNILPNATYWRLNANSADKIVESLDNGIFKELRLESVKGFEPEYIALRSANQLGKILVNWKNTASIPYHAYLEVYEMEPSLAYRNNLLEIPDNKKDSIHSIWFITCTILDHQKSVFIKKTALMSLIPTSSIGMGYGTIFTLSSNKNIYTAIAKATSQLSTSNSDYTYVETHAPALYAIDNYSMPFLHMAPRIPLDTNKQFIGYTYIHKQALLRLPTANMQKIDLKLKPNNDALSNLITLVKAKPGWRSSELYNVIQPLRDVKNNIDYTIETFMSFNPNASYEQEPKSLIQFVDDSLNKIYLDTVLVGNFAVKENITLKDRWINPNVLYNGYDSTDKIEIGTLYKSIAVVAEKQIQGTFKNRPFTLNITNGGQHKTVWMQDKMILFMQGDKAPTQMVIAENSVTEEFLNFILLFSFSEIFQTPTNN